MNSLIVYRRPSLFSYTEKAIFDHGTHIERLELMRLAMLRMFGVPKSLLGDEDANYSSSYPNRKVYYERLD